MNLLQLSYFLALAEHGSFKQTAEALYVSQAAISMQISSLEKEWGMKLFNRMYKKVSLTPSGEVMYDMISRASSDYDFAFARAKRLYQETRTILNIGVPTYFDLKGIEDVISNFQKSHPLLSINLEVCPPSELSLSKGPVDRFDIVINQKHLLHDSSELRSETLRTNYFTINILKDLYNASSSKEDLLASLNGKAFYVPSLTKELTLDYIHNLCLNIGFTPGEIIPCSSIDSAMLAARMGFGVALLEDGMFIAKELQLYSIKTDVKFDWSIAWRVDNEKAYLNELIAEIRKFELQRQSM